MLAVDLWLRTTATCNLRCIFADERSSLYVPGILNCTCAVSCVFPFPPRIASWFSWAVFTPGGHQHPGERFGRVHVWLWPGDLDGINMSPAATFHAQLASIMEVLANTAVAEICELVDSGYSLLQLEISRSRKENEVLRRKLRLMELRAARASALRSAASGTALLGTSGRARAQLAAHYPGKEARRNRRPEGEHHHIMVCKSSRVNVIFSRNVSPPSSSFFSLNGGGGHTFILHTWKRWARYVGSE